MNYVLRKYLDEDYKFVYKVKKDAYKKYVEHYWGKWNDIDQRNRFKEANVEIQYFKQNPVGKLYERLGFVDNGKKEFHYQMIKRV